MFENFTINATKLINQTAFEQVQQIETSTYHIATTIIIFSIAGLLWYAGGFSKISSKPKSRPCWASWIHWRNLIILMLMAVLYILLRIYPVLLQIGGG